MSSSVRQIRLPLRDRHGRHFTSDSLDLLPDAALGYLKSLIAQGPIPLDIERFELAAMILHYAPHMSTEDADLLANTFGSPGGIQALRHAMPTLAARLYGAPGHTSEIDE
jgi:hypothetical protein